MIEGFQGQDENIRRANRIGLLVDFYVEISLRHPSSCTLENTEPFTAKEDFPEEQPVISIQRQVSSLDVSHELFSDLFVR